MTFLFSIVSINTVLFHQVFAKENQTGTESQSEADGEINEPGNTCAKDSVCKNVNQVNNS